MQILQSAILFLLESFCEAVFGVLLVMVLCGQRKDINKNNAYKILGLAFVLSIFNRYTFFAIKDIFVYRVIINIAFATITYLLTFYSDIVNNANNIDVDTDVANNNRSAKKTILNMFARVPLSFLMLYAFMIIIEVFVISPVQTLTSCYIANVKLTDLEMSYFAIPSRILDYIFLFIIYKKNIVLELPTLKKEFKYKVSTAIISVISLLILGYVLYYVKTIENTICIAIAFVLLLIISFIANYSVHVIFTKKKKLRNALREIHVIIINIIEYVPEDKKKQVEKISKLCKKLLKEESDDKNENGKNTS